MAGSMPTAETIAKLAIALLTATTALSAGWLVFSRGYPKLAIAVTLATGVLILPFAVVLVLTVSFQVFGVDLID